MDSLEPTITLADVMRKWHIKDKKKATDLLHEMKGYYIGRDYHVERDTFDEFCENLIRTGGIKHLGCATGYVYPSSLNILIKCGFTAAEIEEIISYAKEDTDRDDKPGGSGD